MARKLSALLLSFFALLLVSGIALTRRGQDELSKSDVAFHSGELRTSLQHARSAALAYVPGSEHVLGAYARIEAIARGAEARGDLAMSRRAWDTLRAVLAQTEYPGRPPSRWSKVAARGLERVDAAMEREPRND